MLFPLMAAARDRSRIGTGGTPMALAISSVTGKAKLLKRSLWLIHLFSLYHHINPPPVRNVGILLQWFFNNSVQNYIIFCWYIIVFDSGR